MTEVAVNSAIGPALERLLTTRDVADILNVKIDWLYEHVESGYIPRISHTRHFRFHSTQLATWLDTQARGRDCGVAHDGSPLLTLDGLIAYTGLGRSWIYEARRSRGLPHFKLDGHLRFSRPQLDAWLAERPELITPDLNNPRRYCAR